MITKLDVLSGLDPAHRHILHAGRGTAGDPAARHRRAARAVPVYEAARLEGRHSGARRLEDLPSQARHYIDRIQQIAGVPAIMISVGPERDQAIIL